MYYDGGYGSYDYMAAGAFAENVAINAENFPDSNFRSYVSENFDTDSNGVLSNTEIIAVTTIFYMVRR